MIKFAVETFEDVIQEIRPLLARHWQEIAWYKDKVPYAPDWERYKQVAEAGVLHIVTARKDGELVGYLVSMISPGMHYKLTNYAVNDIIYLHPDHRGGRTAFRMFKFAIEEFKKMGVSIFTVHMKTDAPFERLCEALGMQKQEFLYTIYLGE